MTPDEIARERELLSREYDKLLPFCVALFVALVCALAAILALLSLIDPLP